MLDKKYNAAEKEQKWIDYWKDNKIYEFKREGNTGDGLDFAFRTSDRGFDRLSHQLSGRKNAVQTEESDIYFQEKTAIHSGSYHERKGQAGKSCQQAGIGDPDHGRGYKGVPAFCRNGKQCS